MRRREGLSIYGACRSVCDGLPLLQRLECLTVDRAKALGKTMPEPIHMDEPGSKLLSKSSTRGGGVPEAVTGKKRALREVPES
jgi:hypothetical protein